MVSSWRDCYADCLLKPTQVVDRLPLELQRNAELMLEHDKQGRSACKLESGASESLILAYLQSTNRSSRKLSCDTWRKPSVPDKV